MRGRSSKTTKVCFNIKMKYLHEVKKIEKMIVYKATCIQEILKFKNGSYTQLRNGVYLVYFR